jgi:Ca-activated chloride channel homolog
MRNCVSYGPFVSSSAKKVVRGTVLAVFISGTTSFAAAQTAAPAVSPQAGTVGRQSVAPVQNDPRRPEIQPNLAVDRDPIPSPDPETVAEAPGANTPNTPAKAGEIQKGQNGVYTLHENVDEVLLSCTVIDEKGHPVEGLTQADFRVWEDNSQQRVSSFRHQDQPVSIGLLIDNSGSMRDKRTAINNAALELMRESNRQDTAFVVNFNDHAYLDQGFTKDLVSLNRGLSHFDSRGTTALYDAVAASADELSKHATYPKQVLLIVSDGADNASHLTEQKAIQRVQDLGGPVVYSIGLLYDADQREYQRAHEALQTISDNTGGVSYFPRSLEEVNSIASDVARDIRNQYTIGYHSTNLSSQGGFRVVHVEAYGKKGTKFIVRTRRGYYAKPSTPNQNAQSTSAPKP